MQVDNIDNVLNPIGWHVINFYLDENGYFLTLKRLKNVHSVSNKAMVKEIEKKFGLLCLDAVAFEGEYAFIPVTEESKSVFLADYVIAHMEYGAYAGEEANKTLEEMEIWHNEKKNKHI